MTREQFMATMNDYIVYPFSDGVDVVVTVMRFSYFLLLILI